MVGSPPETLGLLLLGAIAVGIGVLCYVWMKNSRATQRRMEENQREMVELLRQILGELRK